MEFALSFYWCNERERVPVTTAYYRSLYGEDFDEDHEGNEYDDFEMRQIRVIGVYFDTESTCRLRPYEAGFMIETDGGYFGCYNRFYVRSDGDWVYVRASDMENVDGERVPVYIVGYLEAVIDYNGDGFLSTTVGETGSTLI